MKEASQRAKAERRAERGRGVAEKTFRQRPEARGDAGPGEKGRERVPADSRTCKEPGPGWGLSCLRHL